MITLISPAKKLLTSSMPDIAKTTPKFLEKIRELITIMKAMSVTDLQQLLHISPDLAALNYKRYQAFQCEGENPMGTGKIPLFFYSMGMYIKAFLPDLGMRRLFRSRKNTC